MKINRFTAGISSSPSGGIRSGRVSDSDFGIRKLNAVRADGIREDAEPIHKEIIFIIQTNFTVIGSERNAEHLF